MPSGRTLADAATMDRTRSPWLTASSSATAAPMLWPSTWARSTPSLSSMPTTSPASAAGVIGRSMSAVRPWPCSSTPITRCRPASVGINDAKFRSMVSMPPCRSTSGVPWPYVSTYMWTPLTSTYPVSVGESSVVMVMTASVDAYCPGRRPGRRALIGRLVSVRPLVLRDPRLVGAPRQHAELVALGVSEDGPPRVAVPEVVDDPRAEGEQAVDLLVAA